MEALFFGAARHHKIGAGAGELRNPRCGGHVSWRIRVSESGACVFHLGYLHCELENHDTATWHHWEVVIVLKLGI